MDYRVKIYAKLRAMDIPVELMESPDSPDKPYMLTIVGGETAIVPETLDELQAFYNDHIKECYNDLVFVCVCSVCERVLSMEADFTDEELSQIPLPDMIGAGSR